jgi:hypothetical protein
MSKNKHHVVLEDGSVHTRNSASRVYDYAIFRTGMRVRDAKALVSQHIRTTDKAITKMMTAVAVLESGTSLNREMQRDSWHDGKDYVTFSIGEGDDNLYLKTVSVEDLAFDGDEETEERVRERAIVDCKHRRNFHLSIKQQDSVLMEMLEALDEDTIVGVDTVPGIGDLTRWEHLSWGVLGWSQTLENARKRQDQEFKRHDRQGVSIMNAIHTAPPKKAMAW